MKVFETSLSAKGECKTLCLDQVWTGVVGLMPVFQMLSKFLQRCKRCNLRQATTQKSTFSLVLAQTKCPNIGSARFVQSSRTPQQISARGMKQVLIT